MINEINTLKEIMQWIEDNDCCSLLITTTANTENEEWQNIFRKQTYRKVLSAYI